MSHSPPSPTEVNLLFGILALQMDFLTRDQLVAAMHAWSLDKTKGLDTVLTAQKALSPEQCALLESLVHEHLKLHDGDPQKGLATVSLVASVKKEHQQIADADVQARVLALDSTAPPEGPRAEIDADGTSSFARKSPAGVRFRILRPHARGGLGAVFVAHDEELHREVALKEIQDRHARDPESRARFVLEAEITGALEHPGIVPVYGLGQYADGRPYYAMRFIKGDSLREAIEHFHQDEPGRTREPSERALELRKLLGRFIDVCQAMQYAHDRGVLHRDLKPGNIMLGKYGETLVVDWGLAKAIDNPTQPKAPTLVSNEAPVRPFSGGSGVETIAGSTLGTPAFMSPEQAAGRLELLGPASDIYSLGATLYCLLTGQPPIEERERGVFLKKVQTGEFPLPRQIKPDVHPALEAICLKAMALRPADRYASPLDLASDIEHWLADEPVAVYREPFPVRAGRWARQHKPLVSGVAAALVVGAIALSAGGIWYHEQQAEAERKQALVNADAAAKRSIVEEKVRQALAQARRTRDELHKILRKPGGVFELMNQPALWESQIKSARGDWQRAFDQIDDALEPHLINEVQSLDTELRLDQADFALALHLERMRVDLNNWVEPNHVYARIEREYPAAFAKAGFAITPGREAEVAVRIRQSAIKDQLLAALDDWADVALVGKNGDLTAVLLEVARQADPHPWRDQVRDPRRWKKTKAMVQLAKELQADKQLLSQQSPQLLLLVGRFLPTGPTQENWLRTAQALHPTDFWLNFALGYILQEKPAPLEAAGFYRVALAIRPNNAAAYNNLGNVLHASNELPAAIDAYRKALAIDPDFALAWTNLGRALTKTEDLVAGFDAFDKGLTLNPTNAVAWYNLGTAYTQQNQPRAAIDAYRKAVAANPKYEKAWYNLGTVLGLNNDLPAAIDACEKVLAINPKHALAWNNLGVALRLNKDSAKAVSAGQKSIELNKNNAESHINLGLAFRDQGDFSAALNAFEEGHRLVSQTKGSTVPSAAFVKNCQVLIALDKKLPSVLKGEAATVPELLAIAEMCQRFKKRHADAADLYSRAFALDPKTVENRVKDHRYRAACSAALAAADNETDARERTRRRTQTLNWLHADLTSRARASATNPLAVLKFLADMHAWQTDVDLASLRDEKDLSRLPDDERAAAKILWHEVERLAKDAREQFVQTEHKGQLTGKQREQTHHLKLSFGKTYVIDLESPLFNTLARLEDENGKLIAENDDISKVNLNSRVVFTPAADGTYHVVASSPRQLGLGAYTITVREFAATKK